MAGPTDHLNQLTDRRLAGQRLRGGAGLWPGAGISALRDWLPRPSSLGAPFVRRVVRSAAATSVSSRAHGDGD